MKKISKILFICFLGIFNGFSQEDKAEEKEASAAQANNPLANMTAISFQNYYMSKLTNAPEGSYMNTTWVRFAKPLAAGKFLLRVSTPLSTVGMPDINGTLRTTSGLGDINAFMSYNFVSKPTTTMGIGPLLAAPTATDNALGSGKWQAGFAYVAFFAKSPVFQYGALVTWQTSFAGHDDRSKTSLGAIQPFYFWQLGKGTYLRGAPIWVFDFANDSYSVPIGIGAGQVVKVNKTMFNIYLEPQFSALTDGVQPQFQLLAGINLQFTGG
ncbi:hypothetical protein [Flavobacterium agrisoli]|nr:hypothetical protein [Flavobacterium agrisoli]